MTYEEHLQTIRDWDERNRAIKRLQLTGYVFVVLSAAFLAWDIYYFLVVFPSLRGCH